ncbi:GH35 family beta-galactosidase [Bacteroides ihuae]|uniref:GH35 family beta-galactosidase n=1 Tax=Bacteroides ihuae TaxID=1852362 RepID=UPI0008D9822B|nr:DUF5597 domain-containing protein [Bacteroides ihuae]
MNLELIIMKRIQLSIVFTLLLALLTANSNANNTSKRDDLTNNLALPIIRETNGVKQLYVNNEPFLIIGAELLNSSASSIEHMKDIWAHVCSLNVNTVFLPINWQQFEPEEGVFDYSLIDSHIKSAHDNNLKLVILWFGSWKNGESHYTPNWVKTDMKRFPRMLYKDKRISTTISNLNSNCLNADLKAYKRLMERIAQVDKDGTVLMVQIENEVGLLGSSRDFSPEATKRFEQQVPGELITYINNNLNKLKPNIREPYVNNGSKKQGSWEEVFGKLPNTDEIFMAWNYAKYINQLAKAGKAIYNIPTFVNAWDASGGNLIPGVWPSGGPNYLMLDIWQAGAPAIDILANDNYSPKFGLSAANFVHNKNPLLVPEACAIWWNDTISAAPKAFFCFGHFKAIGFSPFGIDHPTYHSNHSIKKAYEVLDNLRPLITKAQVEDKINGFMEGDSVSPASFQLGDFIFKPNYNLQKNSLIKGYGLIIQISKDEFIVSGNACYVGYESADSSKPNAQLLSVEEGKLVAGKWVKKRTINGDEFGIKLPPNPYDIVSDVYLNDISILKIKLFKY